MPSSVDLAIQRVGSALSDIGGTLTRPDGPAEVLALLGWALPPVVADIGLAALDFTGLVTAVAAEIGYPVGDREQLLADLSVNHGQYLAGYRGAVRATDQAADGSTEEFRQALLDYRTLFNDLIGAPTADGARSRLSRRDQAAVEQSS